MLANLEKAIEEQLDGKIESRKTALDELTIEVLPSNLITVAKILRYQDDFQFEQLIDLCGIDYLTYGLSEWQTQSATSQGFERGRSESLGESQWQKPRFAVIYHLLSVTLNHRIRLKVFVDEENMLLPSLCDIWSCADWYEREAFDLFGFLFEGHADLRRILTDYGFIGHPFRKDFPVIGELEIRFDEEKEQCIYEPVSIEERILVPKVIRKDLSSL